MLGIHPLGHSNCCATGVLTGVPTQRIDVPQDRFEFECDRLSQASDGVQYERLRWERNEGPMLARFVALAHSAFEQRSEFELAEEGSTTAVKRFILKIHSNRIVAVSLWLKDGSANLKAEQIERSPYRVADATPLSTDFQLVDQQWMTSAMQELFSRVQN